MPSRYSFALSYYLAILLLILFLAGSLLRKVVWDPHEFLILIVLVAAVLFAVLAAWRAGRRDSD